VDVRGTAGKSILDSTATAHRSSPSDRPTTSNARVDHLLVVSRPPRSTSHGPTDARPSTGPYTHPSCTPANPATACHPIYRTPYSLSLERPAILADVKQEDAEPPKERVRLAKAGQLVDASGSDSRQRQPCWQISTCHWIQQVRVWQPKQTLPQSRERNGIDEDEKRRSSVTWTHQPSISQYCQ